ncbi:hypothetical protein ANN_05866 [Periplaneta americana]|uniref:Transposable element Tc3 transposase n=1 Tax=Periplaneta americana TaxID=6978 RepID=A0ABQ8TE33_PERAM|nr:hypothetical protein ANN_05866 [Periplaneta americana]
MAGLCEGGNEPPGSLKASKPPGLFRFQKKVDLSISSLVFRRLVFLEVYSPIVSRVVVITEDVQNVHLLLEYRPHIDVSLTCEHDPKLQEFCVCPQNMPQFDSEGIPNQAPETNKPMILNGLTSRNREGSDQALSPADYPARVRFCQWFLQQCGVNLNFPALVLFTDEAQFTRDGITNFHNQHVWAYENPRATVPSHHQVRFSLNMWAGIIGDRLVGPHVLVNRLTGQASTNFLENTIPHVLEDTPLINRQHIHFLHDGAPAHFSHTARRYLDRRFPGRWIGRGGTIAWPILIVYMWEIHT